MILSRLMMVLSALLLLGVFLFPLWNIRLEAPQYPTPLGMYIHVNKITDENPHDLKNINLLNHYVGMKEIPEHMKEFDIFPPVIIFMSVLGVLVGIIAKKPRWFLAWAILMSVLGAAGLYDFYYWEYDYGHNLDPKAIMSFKNPDGTPMGFTPPILGTKHILNFTAHSYPRGGAFFLCGGIFLSYISYLIGFIKLKKIKQDI